jgi:hypothetical protein
MTAAALPFDDFTEVVAKQQVELPVKWHRY